MTFFDNQARSRRNTRLLLFLFVLAFAAVVLTFVLLAAFLSGPSAINTAIGWTLYAVIAVLSLGVLIGFWMMHGGSKTVLKYLHAVAPPPEPDHPAENRLLNVAEEMSIASGMPLPAIYILRGQKGINAFAVGDSPEESAIAVTEGCLQMLRRDELQGVVAHEFSHIFNGDVRLNVKVSALVFGLSAFWSIGRALLSAAEEEVDLTEEGGLAPKGRRSLNPFYAAAGVFLMCCGWPGMVCGRLLQSIISQEREYLADASAAQFTRNPLALAGALKKIGAAGSRIRGAHVQAFDHFFFAGGTSRPPLYRWMSTHPPLEERILFLDPNFDGNFPALAAAEEQEYVDPERGRALQQVAESLKFESSLAGDIVSIAVQPEQIIAQIGAPGVNHLLYASAVMGAFPQPLIERMRRPAGSAASICAMVLALPAEDAERKAARLRELLYGAHPELIDEAMKMLPALRQMAPQMRLPLLDIAMHRFKKVEAEKRNAIASALGELIDTFHPDSLFAHLVRHLITARLRERSGIKVSEKESTGEGRKILFLLAQAGGGSAEKRLEALDEALRILGSGAAADEDEAMVSVALIGETLRRLEKAPVMFRARLLKAGARCVIHDGYVTVEEAEMLRLLSSALDCPLPPILPAEAKATQQPLGASC